MAVVTKFPTGEVNTGTYTNSTNTRATDGVYATKAAVGSTRQVLTQNGFLLPADLPVGSTVSGVRCLMKGKVDATGGTSYFDVIAVDQTNSVQGTWVSQVVTTTNTEYTIDLWPQYAYKRDDLLSSAGGVRVATRCVGATQNFSIDSVKLEVTYTPPAVGSWQVVKEWVINPNDVSNLTTGRGLEDYWGDPEAVQDLSRITMQTTNSDPRKTSNGNWVQLQVVDGDDPLASGERAEVGYNSWRWGEAIKTDPVGLTTFAIYNEGVRRRTTYDVKLPIGFPGSASAYQLVLQLRSTAPSNAGAGGSPMLSLQANSGRWSFRQGSQVMGEEGSTLLWDVAPLEYDIWTRFTIDGYFSINPATGWVQIHAESTYDGGAIDLQSPTFHTYLLKPENGTSLLLTNGQPIPSHLRAGIYHDPSIAGTTVGISYVLVEEMYGYVPGTAINSPVLDLNWDLASGTGAQVNSPVLDLNWDLLAAPNSPVLDLKWDLQTPGNTWVTVKEWTVPSDSVSGLSTGRGMEDYFGDVEAVQSLSRVSLQTTNSDPRKSVNAANWVQMTVVDGDDPLGAGERSEMGYNSHRWGEALKTDPAALTTYAIYREGQRRRTTFDVKLPPGYPGSTTSWQLVCQLRATAPSNAGAGGSPMMSVQTRANRWQIHQGRQAAEGSDLLWDAANLEYDIWTRIVIDGLFSQYANIGWVQISIESTADGGAISTTSPVFNTFLLKPEVGSSLLLSDGDSIPTHLRLGIYHDPAIAGTSAGFSYVKVEESFDTAPVAGPVNSSVLHLNWDLAAIAPPPPEVIVSQERLATDQTVSVLAEVLGPNDSVLAEVPVIEGEVTLDATASSRGRCGLTLPGLDELIPRAAGDLLTPFGNELRLSRGLRSPNKADLTRLGVFGINSSAVTDAGEDVQIRVDGLDRSWKFLDNPFQAPFTVPSGENVTTAITRVLAVAYNPIAYQFPSISYALPRLFAEEGWDPWEFIQGLAAAIGHQLYFDDNGILVLEPIELGYGVPVASYEEGEGGVLLGIERDWDRQNVWNKVIVTGETTDSDAPPVRAAIEDNVASSPTLYGGPFGRKPYYWTNRYITNDVQADAAARGMLARAIGAPDRLSFVAVVDPRRRPGDLISVRRARLGVDEYHILDSVTIPLSYSGTMSCTTRVRAVFE